MKRTIIAPSLLAADFSRMGEAAGEIEAAGAEWTHLDVMDGNFVPNISFGPKMAADLRRLNSTVFDAHLMVSNPGDFIAPFAQAGADYITFHVEAAVHVHRLVTAIKDLGKKAGLSIVPSTPVESVRDMLPFLDLVLVMTVNPGFGGQALLPFCLDKVRDLAAMRAERNLGFLISVDGGINGKTAALAREAGADVLVAGEAFFKAADKKAAAAMLKGEGES